MKNLDHKIQKSKKLLCRELNTGKYNNGFFYFDGREIRTEICNFEEFFYIRPENDVFLQTENNHIISLHTNISAPPGQSSRCIDPKMSTYKQKTASSKAVIGHDKWKSGDILKRVSFYVDGSDDVLKHKEKFDAFVKSNFYDHREMNIFKVSTGDLNVSVDFTAEYNTEFSEPRDLWHRIEIEFLTDVFLSDYLESVLCIVRFLSFSLGIPLMPSDFKICRLSFEDMVAAVDSHSYPGDYDVEYAWSKTDFNRDELWSGASLVLGYDDVELVSLKECLVLWIQRDPKWRKAGIQMMYCLSLNREISSERLLSACKWFEEIPLADLKNAINDDDVKEIADVAASKALELGHKCLKKRITGSLKSIKSETHENSFRRLWKMVKTKFSIDYINDEIVTDLKRAIGFRGRAAHGHFTPSDNEEFRTFSKSIYAMEALCFLLTAYDLPISQQGIERLRRNPVVAHYRMN